MPHENIAFDDLYNQDAQPITDTTSQGFIAMMAGMGGLSVTGESQTYGNCVVVFQPEETVDEPYVNYFNSAIKKQLWQHAGYSQWRQPIRILIDQEALGFQDRVIVSTTNWPRLWDHEVYEPAKLKGIFPVNVEKKVLFSRKSNFQLKSMMRSKPTVIISRRNREEID